VIDIFSISLKTINPKTFSRASKGTLSAVLDAIKIFHTSPRHLEISNLIVTGLTDNIEEIRALSRWVRSELSDTVPLHFVRFHPAYRYTRVSRTPIPILEKARKVAKDLGLKHVYIGNTYRAGHADLTCPHCGNLLVERFGLHTKVPGVSIDARCLRCKKPQKLVLQPAPQTIQQPDEAIFVNNSVWHWRSKDTRNLHAEIRNTSDTVTALACEHINKDGDIIDRELQTIPGGVVFRYAITQHTPDEEKIRLAYPRTVTCTIKELQDRAHFPLRRAV
jgi:pyruvate formate lyase activating enzyme